jgi:hypothetical protein
MGPERLARMCRSVTRNQGTCQHNPRIPTSRIVANSQEIQDPKHRSKGRLSRGPNQVHTERPQLAKCSGSSTRPSNLSATHRRASAAISSKGKGRTRKMDLTYSYMGM